WKCWRSPTRAGSARSASRSASFRTRLPPPRRALQQPKRHVDPLVRAAGGLGNAMVPGVLHVSAHHQQAAMREVDLVMGPTAPLPLQPETARGSEGERGDQGVAAELWLVVRVISHAVLAIPVPVEQHMVERRVSCTGDLLDQGGDAWGG